MNKRTPADNHRISPAPMSIYGKIGRCQNPWQGMKLMHFFSRCLIPHPTTSEHPWLAEAHLRIHNIPDISNRLSWRCGYAIMDSPWRHKWVTFVNIVSPPSRLIIHRQWRRKFNYYGVVFAHLATGCRINTKNASGLDSGRCSVNPMIITPPLNGNHPAEASPEGPFPITNFQSIDWFCWWTWFACTVNSERRHTWLQWYISMVSEAHSNFLVAPIHSCGRLNTLRPRRNEQHFADDIFKRIFFNENVWISIKISLKFVPKGPINNIPPSVQIMAWRRSGDKPLSEPMMVSLLTHICVTRPQWVKHMCLLP